MSGLATFLREQNVLKAQSHKRIVLKPCVPQSPMSFRVDPRGINMMLVTSSEASQQSFSPLQRCCSVTHWPPVPHSNSDHYGDYDHHDDNDDNDDDDDDDDDNDNDDNHDLTVSPAGLASTLIAAVSTVRSPITSSMVTHIYINRYTKANKDAKTYLQVNKDRPPPFFNTTAIATVMLEVRTLERDMMMGLSSY